MTDGARNALLGFVYQWVKTAELEVRRSSTALEDDDDFTFLARGRIESERFGQDAVNLLDSGSSRLATLIQYKHSSTGREVSLDDFIEMLEAFDRSKGAAKEESYDVDLYFLVTNRELTLKVQEVMSSKGTEEPHPHLVLRSGKRCQVPKGKKKWIERHGDAKAAASAWHRVVQRLIVKPNDGIEEGMSLLKSFGARHGVLQSEWEASLNRLYGAFVKETTSGVGVRVDDAWLRLHLVGDSDAAALDFNKIVEPHIATRCKVELQDRIQSQHSTPAEAYIERDVHREISEKLDRHPVVFVLGRGGRGKSLAVARYLESVSNERLVVSVAAQDINEAALVESITQLRLPKEWSNSPDRDLKHVFARLNEANGERRPLLLIDLDGLDEAGRHTRELKRLINRCWANDRIKDSPASIVATCRSETGEDPCEDLVKWLDMGPEPWRIMNRIGCVILDDFSERELSVAARQLNDEPEQRLLDALTPSRMVVLEMDVLAGPKDVEDHIIRSLLSPVVWGGYASLEKGMRDRVLDGDVEALNVLAKRLLRRFWQRCGLRDESLAKDIALGQQALRGVAVRHDGESSYANEDFTGACQEEGLGMCESQVLLKECLSYGVVERESKGSWRWTHPFVTSYLARGTKGGHA